MNEDGFANISTFDGSELGCIVALKAVEISQRDDVKQNVDFVARYVRTGLEQIKQQNPDIFVRIR